MPRQQSYILRIVVAVALLLAAIYHFASAIESRSEDNDAQDEPQVQQQRQQDRHESKQQNPQQEKQQAGVSLEALSMEAAGNRTLGFSSINFINLPNRFDRLDAISLQAYLAGVKVVQYPAVEPDQINDVGMPPTHRPALTIQEKGCWRAHANIWSMMLRENLPSVLIIESDVTWDVNIRDIMSNFNKHFTQFLQRLNVTPIHDGGRQEGPSGEPVGAASLEFNTYDPWHSRYWDILSLGQCFEGSAFKDVSLIYNDPHVPAGKDYFGRILGNERVIRKSGGLICTTAYAISRTGAAKLLVRSALDLDNPVDQLMARMIASNDLVVYSVMPTIMAQWQYAKDIGMEHRGANSDLRGQGKELDSNFEMSGWNDVRKSGSVWIEKEGHPNIAFKDNALQVAWQRILGDASLADSSKIEKPEA